MRRDIADRIPYPTIVIMVRARRMNGVGVMQRHLARLKRHRDAVIFAEAVVDRLTEADQVILLRFPAWGRSPSVRLPGIIRMQPASSEASESATQAVTCSGGSRWK